MDDDEAMTAPLVAWLSRRVVLGLTGGIAAYKVAQAVRMLVKNAGVPGVEVPVGGAGSFGSRGR